MRSSLTLRVTTARVRGEILAPERSPSNVAVAFRNLTEQGTWITT